MDRAEQKLKHSNFLIRDKALNGYVRDIACRLAGEHCQDMRVYLVRTALFNASMAPNGMMQVSSGLLLRMSNEAQLAAVLGHEIGHYLERHSVERLRDARSRNAFGQFLGLALAAAGVGSANVLAQLAIAASGLAYSRDQERDADRIGVELMARHGYAPIEASRVWDQLLEELKAGEAAGEEYWNRSVLFATHPPAEERQSALAAAAAARSLPHGGRVGVEAYRSRLSVHRGAFLADEIRRRRFGETMSLLDRLLQALPRDGELQFYRGEAFRMRGGSGDLEKAIEAYNLAQPMERVPPELFRSLGLVYRQLGHNAEAAAAFGRYLELKPDAEDADLVRTYLPGSGT
jgi:predicted Zn-dependent protease